VLGAKIPNILDALPKSIQPLAQRVDQEAGSSQTQSR